MKVLHISTSDDGGAGLCALRIHKSLIGMGVDSKMIVANKTSDLPTVYKSEISIAKEYTPPKNVFLQKYKSFMRRKGFYLSKLEYYQRQIDKCAHSLKNKGIDSPFYTYPLSKYEIHLNPLVNWADIIHIHWVANFIDYPSFFCNIDKPIVWTFHDENIGMGGFHYRRDKDKYYAEYRLIEDELCRIKRESLFNINTHHFCAIALSKEMKKFLSDLVFLPTDNCRIINNSVDIYKYRILDKKYAREVLGIPYNHIVFSFCANSLNDSRKGLVELIEALERLKLSNITLLCIGSGYIPCKTALNTISVGRIFNEDILSMLYSCSDYFVMPSFQEAFAQTPIEAMACGVPVIAFPCSGTEELITNNNGIRCSDFTVDSLFNGICKAIDNNYSSENIRMDIIERFSPSVIANQYINVYNDILSNNLS